MGHVPSGPAVLGHGLEKPLRVGCHGGRGVTLEARFARALIDAPGGLWEAIGADYVAGIARWRFHLNMIVATIGRSERLDHRAATCRRCNAGAREASGA